LVVSDPVAIIKQTPEQGTTSTIFSFDASTSYSVISSIRLYTREIFDQQGEKLDTIQGKSIKQQFQRPGAYTIKLTAEDELGKTDITTSQVYVESTEPIAQFTITPRIESDTPSEFILNAGPSSDADQVNGFDTLSYEWKFGTDQVDISSNDPTNEEILATFNQIGTHTVKLLVKDDYGKIGEIEKNIKVESTLRPEIFISPKAAIWGTPITFAVKSNEPIISYDRDFGDGNKRTVQTNRITHNYAKVETYTAKLTVQASNGQQNTLKRQVFIGEKNSPIAAYTVLGNNQLTMTQNETCPEILGDKKYDRPSYRIERYLKFRIDPSESVNAKGTNNNLSYYFQPKNDEIFKTNNFSQSFDELGCQFIDLTVEDISLGKNDKVRIWFYVVNALPTIKNIILFFPQYGNEVGVGFQENNVKDIFNNRFDPLMVKVMAQGPEDPDGFISYFKRYYYYKDDPTRILETKITPSDIPYTFFSLPRMPGEFMFGVSMYDNDDGKEHSEHIIGNGPIVFFPPDVQRPDIPLVTLKSDKVSTEVGDEITFNVVSKVISDRADFKKERTIQYDFDGDGERDLTTKKDRVTHIYTKANEEGYIPRAAVLYRGYKGIGK